MEHPHCIVCIGYVFKVFGTNCRTIPIKRLLFAIEIFGINPISLTVFGHIYIHIRQICRKGSSECIICSKRYIMCFYQRLIDINGSLQRCPGRSFRITHLRCGRIIKEIFSRCQRVRTSIVNQVLSIKQLVVGQCCTINCCDIKGTTFVICICSNTSLEIDAMLVTRTV